MRDTNDRLLQRQHYWLVDFLLHVAAVVQGERVLLQQVITSLRMRGSDISVMTMLQLGSMPGGTTASGTEVLVHFYKYLDGKGNLFQYSCVPGILWR